MPNSRLHPPSGLRMDMGRFILVRTQDANHGF